jgi:hypothetical protein
MALSAAQAAHNLAVDAAIVTWGAAVAEGSAETVLTICGTDIQKGVTAATPPLFVPGRLQYHIRCASGTEAADNIWAIGGWQVAKMWGCIPLFYKFTNQGGDLTA